MHSYRDAKMLLVQVHQFHFIVRDFVLVRRLEDKSDCVSIILCFDCDDILIGSTLEDFRHAVKVEKLVLIALLMHLSSTIYLPRFMPIDRFRSHLYLSKPSARRERETRLT